MTIELDDVNTVEQAAAYLKVTPPTVRGLASKKRIGHLKTGRVLTFTREALEEYVRLHQVAPVAPNPFGLTDASARRLRAS